MAKHDDLSDLTEGNLLEWRIPIRYEEAQETLRRTNGSAERIQKVLAAVDLLHQDTDPGYFSNDWIDPDGEKMAQRRFVTYDGTSIDTMDILAMTAAKVDCISFNTGDVEIVRVAHASTISKYTDRSVQEGLVVWA